MKRFKLIFHIIYVIITLIILYFSIDVLMNTEQYLSKIKLSSYITFPKKIMGVFLFLSIIMIAEFVIERIHVYKVKDGIKAMEDEILHLKAKLYDQSQDEKPVAIAEETVEEPKEEVIKSEEITNSEEDKEKES